MSKTILITGSTDGIGLETAKKLIALGHKLILHGRNPEKLKAVVDELSKQGTCESYVADFSDLNDVTKLADQIKSDHSHLDVLINNAGIFRTPNSLDVNGYDIRFTVNTLAPYLLTKCLLPCFSTAGRVINLSSAAQAPVDLKSLSQKGELEAMQAYSQSKLAITMWSFDLAHSLGKDGPAIIAVNPGSLLGSKMVKESFGIAGNDIGIGADILVKASLSDEFLNASGQYFDNDSRQFTNPHPDALDEAKCRKVVSTIEDLLENHL